MPLPGPTRCEEVRPSPRIVHGARDPDFPGGPAEVGGPLFAQQRGVNQILGPVGDGDLSAERGPTGHPEGPPPFVQQRGVSRILKP
eukprot:5133899-Pyramimonas_sp.AAC.1